MYLPWLLCPAATVMEIEKERGEGVLEKYHNTEGVQLKKKKIPSPFLFPVQCPYLLSISPSHALN